MVRTKNGPRAMAEPVCRLAHALSRSAVVAAAGHGARRLVWNSVGEPVENSAYFEVRGAVLDEVRDRRRA